jgi:hypothetical protein
MTDKNIKIEVLPSSSSNVVHASLFVGDTSRDIGTLYMTHDEYDELVNVLRAGCIDTGFTFENIDERSFDYDH